MNYYNRFPGDYAADTQHLDLDQHGAYTLLLDRLYSTEKPLPKDLETLFFICRASSKRHQNAVKFVLSEFFVKNRLGYTNKRFEKELKRSRARIKAAKENGKHGGRPPKTKPSGLVSGFDPLTQQKPPHPPSSIHHPFQDQVAADVVKSNGYKPTATAAVPHSTLEQIRDSFESIRSEPFGSREFQNIFADIATRGAPSGSDAMERTIQCCKAAGLAVPGRFFKIKHALEKIESEQLYKRTPM